MTRVPAQYSASALSRSVYHLWCAYESVELPSRRIALVLPSLCVPSKVGPKNRLGNCVFIAARHTTTLFPDRGHCFNTIQDTMHDIFHVFFVKLMAATPFVSIANHSCVKCGEPVAVSDAHTANNGIMDRKLVLVAKNQNRQTATTTNPARSLR
jgi:hypothetical protein